MGIVLPDGILTNSSLQYIRDFITDRAQILGVVSLPEFAFRRPSRKGGGESGSGVKTSLLFLRKKKKGERLLSNYPIFMALAKHIGYDATGRSDKDEFPYIIKAWNQFKKNTKVGTISGEPLCFAVSRMDIKEAFNPLRFTLRAPNEEKWIKIKEIGNVVYETINPKRKAPEQEFDWIRIDDLENEPTIISIIRRVKGKEINGIVQLLKSGDILIARLGPSIANKKFVIVPETKKQCIGSTEFIVLRLKEEIDISFALGVFKTDFYTNLMLSKGRGGTPSRYRLSRSDFMELPFPNVQPELQKKIGARLKSDIDKAMKLKHESKEILEKAKKNIENMILP